MEYNSPSPHLGYRTTNPTHPYSMRNLGGFSWTGLSLLLLGITETLITRSSSSYSYLKTYGRVANTQEGMVENPTTLKCFITLSNEVLMFVFGSWFSVYNIVQQSIRAVQEKCSEAYKEETD